MTWRLLEDPSEEEGREIRRIIAGRCRFLVDESLGEGVHQALRDFGWNSVFVNDVELSGHSDEDVFAYAWRENRILLTHDRDFLDTRRFPYHRNPGVIVLPGGDGQGDSLERSLFKVISLLGPRRHLFENAKIEISESGEWSIHEFHRDEGRHTHRRIRFDDRGSVWEWES